jgi:Ca2+-binding RTX toxin-like protein
MANDASIASATADDASIATATSDNQNSATAFATTDEVVHANASEIGDDVLIEMSISETDDSETELNLDATSIIIPVTGADVPIVVDAEELDGKTIDQVVISVPAGSVLSDGTPNGDGTEWTFNGPPPANLILTPPSELTDYGVETRVISGNQLAAASFSVSVDFTCNSVMPGSGVTQVGDILVVAGTDGKDLLKVQEKKGEFRIKLNKEKSTLSMDGITSVFMCGFNGTDKLIRPAKSTVPGVLDGGNGKDRLTGSNADETLLGGGGDDKINAKGGDDLIDGGNGRDKINAGKGNDIALGGAGVDVVSGSSGRDILFGGQDKDQVKGGSGEDIMIGGSTNLSDEQLQSILADWTSEGTYENRVTTIRSSLIAANITDTADSEKLAGGGDTDWLFANESDVLSGFKDFEELDLI